MVAKTPAVVNSPDPDEMGAVIRGVTVRRCNKCGGKIQPFERFYYFPVHHKRACARCAGADRSELVA